MHILKRRRLAPGLLLDLLLAAPALAVDARAPAPKEHCVAFQIAERDAAYCVRGQAENDCKPGWCGGRLQLASFRHGA